MYASPGLMTMGGMGSSSRTPFDDFDGDELMIMMYANLPPSLPPGHTLTLPLRPSLHSPGHTRRLRVAAAPDITLTREHVPKHCQNARVVVLGPLTLADVDAASFVRPATGVCVC